MKRRVNALLSLQLLGKLKQECTLLVVSHDLKELMPIVDLAWRMQPGGQLERDG
jgi:energy-coupling factor transporter ATP-binding protein EcfA2